MEYILESVVYLVPALVLIGKFLKMIPKLPNYIIPFTLLVLGIIASNCILGWNIESTIQGVFVAGTAVFSNQLVKQTSDALGKNDIAVNYDTEIQGGEETITTGGNE